MINYIAPNPYPVTRSFFSWDLFSSSPSSSSSIGRGIGQLILPAQMREAQNISERNMARFAARSNMKIEVGFIGTHDEALLETIEITPNHLGSSMEQRFIIKFNGNGGQYQDSIERHAQDAQKLGMTVIGFNYRGVGNSQKTPVSFQDLITDGIAQVQRLIDQGVHSTHVLLDGHSLGGGIATKVAEHFHNKGLPVYLWNDRSFASISKAAAGIVAPTLPGLAGASIEKSFEVSSYSIMKPSGWDMNIASAYLSIPEQYRSYMVVAEKSTHSEGDGVISHRASLHQGVSALETRKGISTGYEVNASHTLFGGHNSDRAELSCETLHKNGQDLFEEFACRLR